MTVADISRLTSLWVWYLGDPAVPVMVGTVSLIPGTARWPDRWGQSTIRIVDRPLRLTALDFLYYSGDHRFGALGVSTRPDAYRPCPEGPLLGLDSLEEAYALIQRLNMS